MSARREEAPELLWQVARAFPDVPSWPFPLEPAAVESLVTHGARHGLAPIVARAIERMTVTEAAAQQARRAGMLSAARTLRVKRLLLRALEALAGEGVTPVLLKGYGLGLRLYGDATLRPTSDVDLLVLPTQLGPADRALRQLGLDVLSAETQAYRLAHHHHVNYSGPEGLIELHFRALTCFGSEIPAAPFLENAGESAIEGKAVRYLSPEDELLYLAAHAANHLLQRIGWLLDLKLLAGAAVGLDWTTLVRRAQVSGMATPVYLALDAAQRTLGAVVPPDALRALRPPGWQRALGERLFHEDLLVRAPFEGHKYWAHLATMFLSTTPRHMLRYALHHSGHAAKRRVASALPRLAPRSWRG